MTIKRRCRVGRINTVGSISAEMGRIYRLARWGELDPNIAKTYVTILSAIRDGLVNSEIERRMTSLESILTSDNVVPIGSEKPAA
jgi:hypothetical protein